MNKNINLVDILKDCPKGYKLYSTIHGEVKFEQIITGEKYPIVFSYCDIACEYHIGRVTKDGKNMYSCCGECTLFPEKCQRDWAKFKVEPEMVDGEFYYCDYKGGKYIFIYKEKKDLYKTNNYAIIKINKPPYGLKQNAPIYCGYLAYFDELRKATEEEKQQLLNAIKRDGYKWNEEKKELMKIESDMVDGEFYYCSLFDSVNDSIYIHRKSEGYKTEYYVKLDLFDLALLEDCIITTHEGYIKELRKATEEEKQQLLNVIKREGYKWDEEKKELVKDESRFNINTLQPFDRVLVRNGNDNWTCTLFSNIITNERRFFKCINSIWIQCVPYNDETKYLVGTKKMPPEKYITWEG